MSHNIISSISNFGVEIGVRVLGDLLGTKSSIDSRVVGEVILRCSASYAAIIMKDLGLAHRVDPQHFSYAVGVMASGISMLFQELTGVPIPMTEDAIPNMYAICENAYNEMRR